ncbi:pentapeptide repeat-containing protein [Amycolatopsis sp. 195334CR]|uniref:pentapeptide repeat-containing protein n=1 Tax=Amycolatopsis sp. 195334CR TaxID=2814588 RepID=UPI001A8DCFB9|nr:pentapeptide repeat-containing protein [Amycolatopsis sp. 195334CR]MBN6039986.1 pentapeptide repeat-containing protein [Amycolatopsis sp. 195334CR]
MALWTPWLHWSRLAGRVGLWALAVVGGLAVLAGVGWLVWQVPPALYGYVPDPKDRASAEAVTRTGLIAGLAGMAALGSLALTARTYRLTQQGQITDRYTTAVGQLGDDKLDIRLGGIYALERLAVDSKRDHPIVVEVLSAYVRERTASRATPRVRPPGRQTTRPSSGARRRSVLRVQPMGRGTAYPLRLSAKRAPLGVDIQAALTVLGRLPTRLGVNRADLSGADLTGANLFRADLSGANLMRADLTESDLTFVDLTDAQLGEANLTAVLLLKVNLTGAHLGGADLTRSLLGDADLTDARLRGADLTEADLGGTNLTRAELSGADLSGASLGREDWARARLNGARWDDQTVWPAGIGDEIRARSTAVWGGFVVDPDPPSTG